MPAWVILEYGIDNDLPLRYFVVTLEGDYHSITSMNAFVRHLYDVPNMDGLSLKNFEILSEQDRKVWITWSHDKEFWQDAIPKIYFTDVFEFYKFIGWNHKKKRFIVD